MQPLTLSQIYDALDPTWWVDAYPLGTTGPVYPTTMIYFTNPSGTYGNYVSTGPMILTENQTEDPTTREYYISNNLMWDTARYLHLSQCTGNVTNIQPPEFQVFPIYYK